jgi:hypothetical protein
MRKKIAAHKSLAARAFSPLLLLMVLVIGVATGTVLPASPAAAAEDRQIRLLIENDADAPMKCVVLFGHWVTQDVDVIAPRESGAVQLFRAGKDGALYIPRFDGRKMMVERIACGRANSWWETIGDVPLMSLREKGGDQVRSTCQATGRVACSSPVAVSNSQN